MIKQKIAIYALKDPRTGLVCYIGQTNNPKLRLSQHLKDFNPLYCENPKRVWIKELWELGLKPVMVILEEVNSGQADEVEIKTIKKYFDAGFQLFNTVENKEGKKLVLRARSKQLLKIFILDTTEQYVGTQLRADTFYRIYVEWWWKVQNIGNKLSFKEFKTCLFELGFIEDMDTSLPMVKKLFGLKAA